MYLVLWVLGIFFFVPGVVVSVFSYIDLFSKMEELVRQGLASEGREKPLAPFPQHLPAVAAQYPPYVTSGQESVATQVVISDPYAKPQDECTTPKVYFSAKH